ncbi:MAG: helix-turn-helix domain-containing protein [Pseudorhodoplanes sp.]|nr:helix-turn-helix domain-containing protein [Pseudorhodoplanes sp.]
MQVIEAQFDDIDAMAASPLAWHQDYEQLGRGRFHGALTQVVLNSLQLGRLKWSPGVLQRGTAPAGTLAFGMPIRAEGSLHVRRRPVVAGELIAANSRDDIGFAATGATDIVVTALPIPMIERWLSVRRGVDRLDVNLPTPHLAVRAGEMRRRAHALAGLLDRILAAAPCNQARAARSVESQIFDVILDMIPSAEIIEPLHHRARIARQVLDVLRASLESPPTVTELCERTGARERTLYLCCMEAFGRPPARLLAELRLNAARRALSQSREGVTVTSVAALYGFTHFGRFSQSYLRQFGELPSETLAKAAGWRN